MEEGGREERRGANEHNHRVQQGSRPLQSCGLWLSNNRIGLASAWAREHWPKSAIGVEEEAPTSKSMAAVAAREAMEREMG
jgi:hypothetical protein